MKEEKLYTCQDCHGSGGETDVILEDGTGPWEECPFCKGTGKVTGKQRVVWLNMKKTEKRFKNEKNSR